MVLGVEYKSFSFIYVLQPAITYRKWAEYNKKVEYLEKEPENRLEAIKMGREHHKFTLGVFYQTQKLVYHKKLYEDHNPITKRLSREIRLEKVKKILDIEEI